MRYIKRQKRFFHEVFSQSMTWEYRGLQGVTWGYKGLHGITKGYRGLQGVTRGYRGFQGVTGGDKGLPVSYTHLRAHETDSYLVCRLLLEKKK